MNNVPIVTSIHLYPVKSCKALELVRAHVGPRGLMAGHILDRSWMLINAKGFLVSQREEPSLARVKVELINGRLGIAENIRLSAETMSPLLLDSTSVGNERVPVIIHGKETVGHLAVPEVSQWFSEFLGKSVSAVHQNEDDLRLADPNFTVMPGEDTVSFADGFPYLLTTQATLQQLNSHLDIPVSMERFRPNIVIGNTVPEEEYSWRAVNIGAASLSHVKPCTRCTMTTIDQETGTKTGEEPMDTLRRTTLLSQKFGEVWVRGAIFGENAVPTRFGEISVGDVVEIISTKPVYKFRGRTPTLG